METTVAKENDQLSQRYWSRKKWTLWYRHQGRMMRQRETACVFIMQDFEWLSNEITINYLKPANLLIHP